MQPTHTNQRLLFQTQDPHFKCEPAVASNVSPVFWTSAHRFECEPVISNVSLSFRMSARRFKHEPIVSNVSLSFQMWAHHFQLCQPVVSNVTHGWQPPHSLWPWMQPNHGVQAMSTVGTMYRVFVYKGTCNYIIYLLLCTRPVWDWLRTGLNHNWFRPVLQPQKTAWNHCGLVYDGSGLSFWEFEKGWTGLGPGLFKYGWKTRLDQTSTH